ncbi:Uma2 family endonuclease [Catenuloplanes nepalensis]|uniref:Uma2 family endonuclease n=1 Tax=Catenuloplanes nepalensis TaxID=587533 RepID=A0ABT9N6K2_9ACTN|nr:Uma2 family endonuclease [Catenuloplanes nepalensis]MDP9799170.1 Uma2 family endonuclease [Catenuloplanes nepalensis]
MVAPLEAGPSGFSLPRPPFTVDTLFAMPDDGLRYEVLEGVLTVTPPATPEHNRAADRLGRLIDPLLTGDTEAITASAVRMPGGDGLVPDLMVTTADLEDFPRGVPAELVHTVIEVVSPSNSSDDRVKKAKLYAKAGIPCYWRLEMRPWKEHFGPLPALVVSLLNEQGEWDSTIYEAGKSHKLPMVVDVNRVTMHLEIDPAALVGRRR